MATTDKLWTLYIVVNCEGLLYVGITVDVPRRMNQHNSGKGARFTRGRGPWFIAYLEALTTDVRHALRRERAVKRLHRPHKLALAHGFLGPTALK